MDVINIQENQLISSKDKIDAVLGITGGKSVDDFLDSLSLDTEAIQETMSSIDDSVKNSIQKIDNAASQLQKSQEASVQNANQESSSILQLKDIDLSMQQIEEMIQLSKKMFKHIAESILTTDLVDSELVGAASKLLESIHINISEFIQLYRSKQQFVDKIKVMIFQQEQKKELMMLKHKLDLEKLQMKSQDAKAVEAEGLVTYSQESIVKAIDDYVDDDQADASLQ